MCNHVPSLLVSAHFRVWRRLQSNKCHSQQVMDFYGFWVNSAMKNVLKMDIHLCWMLWYLLYTLYHFLHVLFELHARMSISIMSWFNIHVNGTPERIPKGYWTSNRIWHIFLQIISKTFKINRLCYRHPVLEFHNNKKCAQWMCYMIIVYALLKRDFFWVKSLLMSQSYGICKSPLKICDTFWLRKMIS